MKNLRNGMSGQKRMGLRFTLPVLAAVLPFSASAAGGMDASLPGETIFSGRAVAELNAAWHEIAGGDTSDNSDEFPLEAKRSILEGLKSGPVVAGFFTVITMATAHTHQVKRRRSRSWARPALRDSISRPA